MPGERPSPGIIPGVVLGMGGRDWTVPPLTLGQLRRLLPRIEGLSRVGAAMDPGQIAAVVEIVAAAMSRNYPEASAETVAELLDLGNAAAVLRAVLTGSGLEPAAAGEAGNAVPGEAEAVASSAGPRSTEPSPPPAAIPTRSSTP